MDGLRLFFAASLAVLMAACGGGGEQALGVPVVASVSLSPLTPTLLVGDSLQITATAKDAAGNTISGRTVRWTSDDPATVSVTAQGMVSALREGETSIRATVDTQQAATLVKVVAPTPNPASVDRVEISPASATVEEGGAHQFSATPVDASGKAVTGRGMHWTVLDPQIALIDGSGLITALRAGATSVSVRVEGKTAAASLRVETDYPYGLLFGRTAGDGSVSTYMLAVSDPAAVALPVFADLRDSHDPAASPDGTRIAFVVPKPWGSAIVVSDRDGGNAIQLTVDGSPSDQPAWSADGTRLAFRVRPVGHGADIWVMDAADGANAVNLTASHGATNQGSPAWSPLLSDGTERIAYTHSQDGLAHIWTMLPDGEDKLQVTTGNTVFDDEPDWSPDGDKIVFTRSGDGIFGDLYVINTWGGGGVLLMQLAGPLAGGQFSPAWSPDGRLIAFTSKHAGDQSQIFTVWSDGTRLAQRTGDPFDHTGVAWLVGDAVQ